MSDFIFFEREFAYINNPVGYPYPLRIPISFSNAAVLNAIKVNDIAATVVEMADGSYEVVVVLYENEQPIRAGLLPYTYTEAKKRLHLSSENGEITLRAHEGTYTLFADNGQVHFVLDSTVRLFAYDSGVRTNLWRFAQWAVNVNEKTEQKLFAGITQNTPSLIVGYLDESEGQWRMGFSKAPSTPLLLKETKEGHLMSLEQSFRIIPLPDRTFALINVEGLLYTHPLL